MLKVVELPQVGRVVPVRRMTLVRAVQFLNAAFSMLVSFSGRLMLVRAVQPLNVQFPMLCHPFRQADACQGCATSECIVFYARHPFRQCNDL